MGGAGEAGHPARIERRCCCAATLKAALGVPVLEKRTRRFVCSARSTARLGTRIRSTNPALCGTVTAKGPTDEPTAPASVCVQRIAIVPVLPQLASNASSPRAAQKPPMPRQSVERTRQER